MNDFEQKGGILNRKSCHIRRFRQRKGAMLIFLAILLPVVLAVCAYAVNVVYMELARTEIQISIDLASRAAVKTLASTGSRQLARAKAQELLDENPCLNSRIVLSPNDVMFGVAVRLREEDRYSFKRGPAPNAIQLRSRQQFELPMLFPMPGVPVSIRPLKNSIATQTEMDVAILIDRSSSMSFAYDELSHESTILSSHLISGLPVGLNSRWRNMVSAIESSIQLMLSSITEEQVSLTTFSDIPIVESQLTSNYSLIIPMLRRYSDAYLGGRSDLSLGMLSAATTLTNTSKARKWATRIMIIVSDGNTTSALEATSIAKDLAAQGITIFTISCSVDSNVKLMSEIAKIGHGRHFHSASAADFLNAFREISNSLPTLITN